MHCRVSPPSCVYRTIGNTATRHLYIDQSSTSLQSPPFFRVISAVVWELRCLLSPRLASHRGDSAHDQVCVKTTHLGHLEWRDCVDCVYSACVVVMEGRWGWGAGAAAAPASRTRLRVRKRCSRDVFLYCSQWLEPSSLYRQLGGWQPKWMTYSCISYRRRKRKKKSENTLHDLVSAQSYHISDNQIYQSGDALCYFNTYA